MSTTQTPPLLAPGQDSAIPAEVMRIGAGPMPVTLPPGAMLYYQRVAHVQRGDIVIENFGGLDVLGTADMFDNQGPTKRVFLIALPSPDEGGARRRGR